MNQILTYLSGYTVAAMMAISSAVTVACFMTSSTAIPFAIISTFSCFILNLLLYWQEFENIVKLPNNLTPANAIPIFLTGCASMIMYATTVFGFYGLGKTYPVVHLLLPISLIHIISICSAIGSFGLYISDFIDLANSDRREFIVAPEGETVSKLGEFILGGILSALLLSNTTYPILLFASCAFAIQKLAGTKPLCRVIAITSSMILTWNGMGSSLPTLYRFARTTASLYTLKILSWIGLFSLLICDALFSRNVMDYIINNQPTYQTPLQYTALGLAVCNGLANSQMTAAGKGFFNLEAWLGGIMSFATMTKSTQEMAAKNEPEGKKESEVKPPLSAHPLMSGILLLYNGLLYACFSEWLSHSRPKAYEKLCFFLAQPLLSPVIPSITRGSAAKMAVVGLHAVLHLAMPPHPEDAKKNDDLAATPPVHA